MAARDDGENAGFLQRNGQRKVELLARFRAGTKKVAKVAKTVGRINGRKSVARKGAKGKRKVAREKPERVGRVARQNTLQHGAGKEATHICTPSMKTTVKT